MRTINDLWYTPPEKDGDGCVRADGFFTDPKTGVIYYDHRDYVERLPPGTLKQRRLDAQRDVKVGARVRCYVAGRGDLVGTVVERLPGERVRVQPDPPRSLVFDCVDIQLEK